MHRRRPPVDFINGRSSRASSASTKQKSEKEIIVECKVQEWDGDDVFSEEMPRWLGNLKKRRLMACSLAGHCPIIYVMPIMKLIYLCVMNVKSHEIVLLLGKKNGPTYKRSIKPLLGWVRLAYNYNFRYTNTHLDLD